MPRKNHQQFHPNNPQLKLCIVCNQWLDKDLAFYACRHGNICKICEYNRSRITRKTLKRNVKTVCDIKGYRKCNTCSIAYPLEEQYFCKNSNGYFSWRCKQCYLKSLRDNRNTKILPPIEGGFKICIICKEEKPLTLQYFYWERISWRPMCRSCRDSSSDQRLRNFKIRGIEYLGSVCSLCHTSLHTLVPDSFDFHHVTPENKDRKMFKSRNWEIFEQELKKCVLLCANCHRIIHSPSFPNGKRNPYYIPRFESN